MAAFNVLARSSCPHLPAAFAEPDALVASFCGNACAACASAEENWVCLSCAALGCSRHVAGHGSAHVAAHPYHAVALSLSDLSVWCYTCEAYLDAFKIRSLHPSFRACYAAKFPGEEPDLPKLPAAKEDASGGSSGAAGDAAGAAPKDASGGSSGR